MKGFRLFSVCLLVLMLFSAWAPMTVTAAPPESVQASTLSKLTINNKTGVDVVVKINGPKAYQWTVKPGKWTYEVERGKYKVEYNACGQKKKFSLPVNSGTVKMNLTPCPMVKVVMTNYTGQNVVMYLTGPAKYTITLVPGVNRFKVIKGTYKITAYACGVTNTVTLTFKTSWRYWIKCN